MDESLNKIPVISGPYRATKLWNAAVRAFHSGMPLSRHRRGLRIYDDCFSGSEAVAWLQNHLRHNPNFSNSVSREQTTALLKKFIKCGLLEDAVSGDRGYSLQFRERGLYRFSGMSPLKALRTPGRSSSSELRASTRRLRAEQNTFASPPLADNKVCKTEKSLSKGDNPQGVDGEDLERPASFQSSKFNESDHVDKALNILGVSKKTYDQYKMIDKENCSDHGPKLKENKSRLMSFKSSKRHALQPIENTTNNGITQRNELVLNTAIIGNHKTPANVYVPLSEVRKNFCNEDKMLPVKLSADICPRDERTSSKENVPSISSSESINNAVNTLTEVSRNDKDEKDKYSRLISGFSTMDPSSRTRAKSFLHKQSRGSKYSSLIPKFGESGKTGNSLYSSSKTISPKLLHSVLSSNTQTANLPNFSSKNTFKTANLNEKSVGNAFVAHSDTKNIQHNQTISKSSTQKFTTAVRKEEQSSHKFSNAIGDSDTLQPGSQLASKASVSPETEQRIYVEAWLEIMEKLMYGCPLSLPRLLVHGMTLRHNQQQVSRRGVVLVPAEHPDDLPTWVLAAMRFLAHWPSSCSEQSMEGCSVPNYPGVEVDVYRMIKDYFTHQPLPVIPTPLATALLEIITAMEFLDISFRDPRERFSLRRQHQMAVGSTEDQISYTDDLLASDESLRPKRVSGTSNAGQVNRLGDGAVSVFATLPRSTGKTFTKEREIADKLEKRDSVEDLMLNMSIGGNNQHQDFETDALLSCGVTETKPEIGPRFLNASYDKACNHSPTSRSKLPAALDPVWCTERESEAPPTNLVHESNILSQQDTRTESRKFEANHIVDSEGPLHVSSHPSRSPSDVNYNLKELSSTNISHIERFTYKNSNDEYVSGDDVRRRKNKRRFFSKLSKKKDFPDRCGEPDLRRFSVYESLHSLPGDENVHNEIDSPVFEAGPGSGNCRSCESRKRSYSARFSVQQAGKMNSNGNRAIYLPSQDNNAARVNYSSFQSAGDLQACKYLSASQQELVVHPERIDSVELPPNSCFETAFTSDSPKTRIIPQKSVDTLHLAQLKSRWRGGFSTSATRPKSIAVIPNDEFVLNSLHLGQSAFGSVSCNNSPLYLLSHRASFDIPSKARSPDDHQQDLPKQRDHCFKAPPPPPRRKYQLMMMHDASFGKSHSTGDLNSAQEWLAERRMQRYDSRGESCFSVDSEKSDFSVSTLTDGRCSSSSGLPKSRSLVHKVRDSLRRKKAKIKEGARLKKNAKDFVTLPSSSQMNLSPKQTSLDDSSPSYSTNALCKGTIHGNSSSEVHVARVVSSDRGYLVHQQNVDTLRRLRASSGGFNNPALVETPGARLVQRTKSGGFVNLGLASPSVEEILSLSSGRDSALPPSAGSPFSPSDWSDSFSIGSACASSSTEGPGPSKLIPTDEAQEGRLQRVIMPQPSLSPFTGWSSESTVNYCTNLSTHYASNHQLTQQTTNNKKNNPASDSISPHDGRSSHRSAYLQTSLASTPLPPTQRLESRSNSLSSLYTTALTCYDESDPHPLTATHLIDGTLTQYSSLKGADAGGSDCIQECPLPSKTSAHKMHSSVGSEEITQQEICNTAFVHHSSETSSDSLDDHSKTSNIETSLEPDPSPSITDVPSNNRVATDTTAVDVPARGRDPDWLEAPRVYTPEGRDRLLVCVQLLLLLLQPVARRRLHLLLRLLHKMSNNKQLQLSQAPALVAPGGALMSTRQVVMNDFSWCVLRGGDARWRRLITLLVDQHHTLLSPSPHLARAVTDNLAQVDAAEWQRQRSMQEQGHHLLQLLLQIINDRKLSLADKREKISQFAGLYPTIYVENVSVVPEELRCATASPTANKKKSGRALRSLLRLSSWSHLTKQKTNSRL